MTELLLTAQAGMAINLGQLLIVVVVLVALWMIFAAVVAPRLPSPVLTIVNIVFGAIIAIIAIKVLLSFL